MRRIAEGLSGLAVSGFLTEEMRAGGRRRGFRLVAFDGARATMADVDLQSPHRVGRYRVDVRAIDEFAARVLAPELANIFLVDEIGKMECFSPRFVDAMTALLDASHPVVATIAARGGGFIAEVKQRPDVELWEVTHASRDHVPSRALRWLTETSS